jgi:hypothetical protein
MESAELIERLRLEGQFRLLPLLGNTGQVVGVHLTRFLPDGYLDVVQAWDDRWAVWTLLRNDPNLEAPFTGPTATKTRAGTLAEIAGTLLPLRIGGRHGSPAE